MLVTSHVTSVLPTELRSLVDGNGVCACALCEHIVWMHTEYSYAYVVVLMYMFMCHPPSPSRA